MSDEKDDKWEMPQAVFQSTEGSVPKSLEDTISQSFMPNAETIEIDEDDDILGIMDQLPGDQTFKHAESLDNEPILETATESETEFPRDISEPEHAPEIETEPMSVSAADEHIVNADEPRAAAVAAISSAEPTSVAEPKIVDERRSDYLIYLFMTIAGAAFLLLAIYYWIWPPANVR
jgi:hypothetical protein